MSDTLQEGEDQLPLVSKNHSERECSEPDCPCHEWVKRDAANCPRCGRTMQSDFDPDVDMWRECVECDYREAVSSTSEHQVTKSGTCAISGCPCRGWSAQEKETTARELDSTENTLAGWADVIMKPTSEHQPAARGGGDGDRWSIKVHGNEIDADLLVNGSYVGTLHADKAQQVLTEHNQHQALAAERERLRQAIRDEIDAIHVWKNAIHPRSDVQEGLSISLSKLEAVLNEQRSTSE